MYECTLWDGKLFDDPPDSKPQETQELKRLLGLAGSWQHAAGSPDETQ